MVSGTLGTHLAPASLSCDLGFLSLLSPALHPEPGEKLAETAQGRQEEELQTAVWGRLGGSSRLGWQQGSPSSTATTLGQLRAWAGGTCSP